MIEQADSPAAWQATVREVRLPLPSPVQACANARAFVRGALGRWGVDASTSADIEHVASELVAVALRHGARSLDLGLELRVGEVHVHVRTPSHLTSGGGSSLAAGEPAPDGAEPTFEDGGPELFVVGRLASDWSARFADGGADLWAAVPIAATD